MDDHIDSVNSLARLLQRRKHQLEVAYDGLTALHTASVFRPEIIILDLDLPQLDGYEVATRLRDDAAQQNVLLIALSGYGQDEDRERCAEVGFDHHLLKPIDLELLHGYMAAHFSKREASSPPRKPPNGVSTTPRVDSRQIGI